MLQLLNITKSYQHSDNLVLNTLNLKLEQGDFCTVIGSNGSGKSTLLRIITGELSANEGNVLVNDQRLSLQQKNKLIASVCQDVNKGIIPEMTLLENIHLSKLKHQKASLRFSRSRLNVFQNELNLIQSLGLDYTLYLEKPLNQLSGGQRQLIAMVMAIISEPKILILDEHTSALDPKMQHIIMQYTAQAVSERHLTTLMVTHSLSDAIRYGNRLILLHQGKILLELSGDEKLKFSTDELFKLMHDDTVSER